ncbi:DUF11 domain-containing protein [Streptomyces sp. HNM0645]|uniref:DUF11 domain-containing protein n=1 Tax=Streptomyces sp. HNM0645 TaxID=2782343 RepID=UPI0024B734CA|nr:DUF11 domain-containing protein [Streptomyces sp. HNM0645]MDI9887458.1 DUF11 domain-containing protein [Streptomyces sp. HNM0645]
MSGQDLTRDRGRSRGDRPRFLGALAVTAGAAAVTTGFVPAAAALSAPAPDLEITKTASAKRVALGDTLTFTIRATNNGERDLPDVRFTDDLGGTLDDAVYDRNARTTLGRVVYAEPVLSYSGAIPAGKTATVTYSVTVGGEDGGDGGDGQLGGGLEVQSPRSNCATGTRDARCTAAPVAEEVGELGAPRTDRGDEESHDHSLEQRHEDGLEEDAEGGARGGPGVPPAPGGPGNAAGAGQAGAPAHGSGSGAVGQIAAAGHDSERLWLLGGVALALSAAGAIALAATRDRGNH